MPKYHVFEWINGEWQHLWTYAYPEDAREYMDILVIHNWHGKEYAVFAW